MRGRAVGDAGGPGRFEEERAYPVSIGIPADFLPSARELGRANLA